MHEGSGCIRVRIQGPSQKFLTGVDCQRISTFLQPPHPICGGTPPVRPPLPTYVIPMGPQKGWITNSPHQITCPKDYPSIGLVFHKFIVMSLLNNN